MKLNPDCMRDILMFAENIEYGTQATLSDMCDSLNYTAEEINYTTKKLDEAGLIDVSFVYNLGNPVATLARLNDLTYDGHKVLADIRNEKIWESTKSAANEIGVNSIQALTQIATGVVTQIITKHIGY